MKSGSKRKADQIGTHLDVVTDATYWNGLAEKYEDEVCSSRDDGVNSSLVEALQSNADPKALAVDFGCGPGLYLPTLARLFGQVVGVDLSSELVEKARVVSQGRWGR